MGGPLDSPAGRPQKFAGGSVPPGGSRGVDPLESHMDMGYENPDFNNLGWGGGGGGQGEEGRALLHPGIVEIRPSGPGYLV